METQVDQIADRTYRISTSSTADQTGTRMKPSPDHTAQAGARPEAWRCVWRRPSTTASALS